MKGCLVRKKKCMPFLYVSNHIVLTSNCGLVSKFLVLVDKAVNNKNRES